MEFRSEILENVKQEPPADFYLELPPVETNDIERFELMPEQEALFEITPYEPKIKLDQLEISSNNNFDVKEEPRKLRAKKVKNRSEFN